MDQQIDGWKHEGMDGGKQYINVWYNVSMHLANLRSSIEHLQTMRTYDLDWLDNQHVTDRKRILEGITPEDNVHKDNAHKVTQAHKKMPYPLGNWAHRYAKITKQPGCDCFWCSQTSWDVRRPLWTMPQTSVVVCSHPHWPEEIHSELLKDAEGWRMLPNKGWQGILRDKKWWKSNNKNA